MNENILLDFRWDNTKLWGLDIKPITMKANMLKWHFYFPFWSRDGSRKYDLMPIEVIENPNKYKDHWNRVMESDTSYPIDIMTNPKIGVWEILDGLHRLVRLRDSEDVSVRIVPRELIPAIKKHER